MIRCFFHPKDEGEDVYAVIKFEYRYPNIEYFKASFIHFFSFFSWFFIGETFHIQSRLMFITTGLKISFLKVLLETLSTYALKIAVI